MIHAKLVLPECIAHDLANAARGERETAGVLVAGTARTGAGLRLLGRELLWVPDDCYLTRSHNRLSIAPEGYVPALARAAAANASAIFFHTHPGDRGSPRPSEWDDEVDDQLADLFKIRTGAEIFTSLVVSPAARSFTFTGRGTTADSAFVVDRLLIVGSRFLVFSSFDTPPVDQIPAMFDRNVRAFGGGVQATLAELKVGIVGCGGTGSSVAEQLVRLGVRSIALVDDDVLSDSNVTRVYGSTPADVGRPKVDVLGEHLTRIAPNAVVSTCRALITRESAARWLTDCDVIFGCTDDNAGRMVLSRLSAYYLTPLIDCGVLISSEAGRLEGIYGRVTVQVPGAACLHCRDRVDLARAAAEQLDPTERRLRQNEGYAPELGDIEPAVVPFTTLVASQAVTELLDRLIGFGPEPSATELLVRVHDREMGTNTKMPRDGHFCHPSNGRLGHGDVEPLLGQLWGEV